MAVGRVAEPRVAGGVLCFAGVLGTEPDLTTASASRRWPSEPILDVLYTIGFLVIASG